MNTRLQVEHPVTEEVTGLDLVAWQFRVAAGEKLPLTQAEIALRWPCRRGAGLCRGSGERVSAVDRDDRRAANCPLNVRVDSGVEAGGEVTPFYDAMIAKLIAHARDARGRLDRLARRARSHAWSPGCAPMSAFLACALPRRPSSARARSIPASSTAISPRSALVPHGLISAAAAAWRCAACSTAGSRARQPTDGTADAEPILAVGCARRLSACAASRTLSMPIVIDGDEPEAKVTYGKDGMHVMVDGAEPAARRDGVCSDRSEAYMLRARPPDARARARTFPRRLAKAGAGDGTVKAPMHGKVLELFVRAGEAVAGGQRARGDRGHEDGTHAARAFCRHCAPRSRSRSARKLWKAPRSW